MLKKHSLKVLGLSLLTVVGVMAVSASAAQAKWQLLEGGDPVDSLALNVSVLGGEIMTEISELKIHCNKGSGTAAIQLLEEGAALSGSAAIDFEECKVLGAPACSVTFDTATGNGEATMNGAEEVLVKADSGAGNFTVAHITGPFCAVKGDYPTHGYVILSLLEALKDLVTHLVHIDEELVESESSLQLGKEDALLKGDDAEGNPTLAGLLAHVTTENDETWAVHLVELEP